MMSDQHYIYCITVLTGIAITLENCLAPFLHFASIARCRCMLSPIRSRGIELRGNHSGTAFMRTENIAIAPIIHFFNFRWIAIKFLTAKVTSQLNHFCAHSLICTLNRAKVISIAYVRTIASKLFSADRAFHCDILLAPELATAFKRTKIIFLNSLCKSRGFGVFLTANTTNKNNPWTLAQASSRAAPLFFVPRMKFSTASLANFSHL